jgi:hypothetical protein
MTEGGFSVIVYVVDAADHAKIDDAKGALYKHVLERPESGTMSLLMLSNKQDMAGTLGTHELIERFAPRGLKRPWHVVVRPHAPVSACPADDDLGRYRGRPRWH